VVSLGRNLELDVVAEGVETPEQEGYLIAEAACSGRVTCTARRPLPPASRGW
jgi:sensor c-di-GMP phosphodiesterase-like protein